jgi:exopolysaccharide production protein ExoQ
MSERYIAVKATVFVVLAILGGVGTVHAPVPTFAAVATTFILGLWWFASDRGRAFSGHKGSVSADAKSKPRSTPTTRLVSVFLLGWWLALVAPIAAYSPRGAGDVVQGAAQGSLRNQVLIISFGLVGSLFLPAAVKRFDPAFRWVAALWTLYLCWGFASLLWSVYPPLTLRNAVALALVSVGSFGFGAGFYGSLPNGRDLFVRHVLVAGVLSALVVLVPLPLHWDRYDLLDPAGRLAIGGDFTAYVARPVVCALLVLIVTSVLGIRRWRTHDWLLGVIFVLPLLALKTRGPVVWAMLALAIFYLFYKTRIHDRMLQAGMVLVIGLGTYLYYSEGVFAPLIPYLARGNVEATAKLTGRLPLWGILLPEIGQRPWLGAGFAAFWSPDKLLEMELLAGKHVLSAHNGYLEEVLNTGIVGLAILLMFCICSIAVARRQARLGDPFGWLAILFVVFYLLLNLTSALVQEAPEIPFMLILVILGLMANKGTTRVSGAA